MIKKKCVQEDPDCTQDEIFDILKKMSHFS